MAYEIPGCSPQTYTAGATLTSEKRFAVANNTGVLVNPTAGGSADGVRQDACEAGRGVAVQTNGVSLVEAGAALALGASVATDAEGRAVTATEGDVVLGKAQTAASAAGVFVSVRLTPAA